MEIYFKILSNHLQSILPAFQIFGLQDIELASAFVKALGFMSVTNNVGIVGKECVWRSFARFPINIVKQYLYSFFHN